jgi:hypothetical protein
MLGVSYQLSHFRRGVDAFTDVFTDSRPVDSFESLVSALIVAEANIICWSSSLVKPAGTIPAAIGRESDDDRDYL